LVGNDVVPQVAAREAHQRSLKFSCFTRKILLQQYLPRGDIGCLAWNGSGADQGDLTSTNCRWK
jgi:hypothetical protein